MSTICGLPTISTLIDLVSLSPPPPPAPHPLSTRLVTAAAATVILPAVDLLVTVYLQLFW